MVPWRDRVQLEDGTVAVLLGRNATSLTVQSLEQPDTGPRTLALSPRQTIEPGVRTLLADVESGWLVLYLLCVVASSSVLITRWQYLLQHDPSTSKASTAPPHSAPTWRWCAVIWARSQVINLLPLGHIGGDLYRIERSRRRLRDSAEATGIIGAERAVGVVALVLVAGTGLSCSGLLPIAPAVGIGILLCVGFSGCMALRLVTPYLASWTRTHEASPRWITWLRGTLAPLVHLTAHPKRLLITLGLSVSVQLLAPLTFAVVDRALGLHTPVWCYLVAIPMITVAVFLPIHIAGIGILEGGLYLTLHQWADLGAADVLALSAVARFVNLTWLGVLATAFLMSPHKRVPDGHRENSARSVVPNAREAGGRFTREIPLRSVEPANPVGPSG
jgi:hypothetical protein